MKLLLDLGNTRCKYAVLEEGRVKKHGIQNYSPFGKIYGVKSLCDQYGEAEGVVISSVLSKSTNSQIQETLANSGVRNIFFLKSEENSFGVKLAYIDPSAMGVDRVAALIAVNEMYSGNSCVIDCGTAVTIDALDAEGNHRGGVILPGVVGMRKALLNDTKIKVNDEKVEFNVMSNTTEAAIHTGSICAVAGGVDYVINRMVSDYDSFDQIVCTGGGTEQVQEYLSEIHSAKKIHFVDTLVLDGLRVVARDI